MTRRTASISRGRRGFTLLEMVAAAALSVALMTVVLSVLRTATRRPPPPPPGASAAAGPVADLIRWDLANAVVVGADRDGLTVAGYASLDPATADPTHEPAAVAYRVRAAGGHTWLVREQSPLRDRAAPPWAELVAADVAGLTVRIQPPTTAPAPAEQDPTPVPFRNLAGLRAVPGRVRVTVRFADGSAVDVEAVR